MRFRSILDPTARSHEDAFDFDKPTPESLRIQAEHKANEDLARSSNRYILSDPSSTGGGILYGPDGYIACVSLGSTEPGVTEQRTAMFQAMLDKANR